MASWSTIQNLINFKQLPNKISNLYFLTFTVLLCIIFYCIGLYQNSFGISAISKPSSSSPSSSSSSMDYHAAETTCELQNTTATPKPMASTPLDFSAHHYASDPPAALTRVPHFPSCDPSLSEYTPCEDLQRSLKFSRDRYIYKERHCPEAKEVLKCRIPAPYEYKVTFRWPESRNFARYGNVPHKWLAVAKKNQNWVQFLGDRLKFPGGGTMFPKGADAYIEEIGKVINFRDGSIRTAIDTGCGVASFGAYLLSRNVLTVSFAPKDTHEAQVQLALERGVPALIGILASVRLPYPSRAFDMAHCSRCLIPWGQHDGLYLIEMDRVLRPGGYWILSGPPINWEKHWKGWDRTAEDLKVEQDAIENVAKRLCWKKVTQKRDIAVWQKPTNHIHCEINKKILKKPSFCDSQDSDKAWYTKIESCLTPLPKVSDISQMAGGKLANWPERLATVPPRINSGIVDGITAEIFKEDTEMWKKRVAYYKKFDSQLAEPGRYRNLLDMNAYLGGFAAAIVNDPAWVMNVVPAEAKVNTLGVIYERGLIGTYQNWCEAMSTYPRSYDFIHADSVFSLYNESCKMEDILLEMDRILRPQGTVILRDDVDILVQVKSITDAMQWTSTVVDHEAGPKLREKVLLAAKQYWTAPAPRDENQTAT